MYITTCFEEKITILLLIFTLYLFIKDYLKICINITNVSIRTLVKDFSLSVIILATYQLLSMLDNSNYDELKTILISLVFIPTFAIVISIIKYLVNLELITVRWENKTLLSTFELFKLYTYTLFKSKNYLYMQSMNETLIHNRNSNYNDVKKYNLTKKRGKETRKL